MGLSSSSLLDENRSNMIKGRAEAELKNFASFYKKQYTLAFLSHIHEELVQRKEEHTQLLKQWEPPEAGNVFYEDHVLWFDDNRKWKERYAVVRANYCLECHESYETYVKGSPPLYKLLPTGGSVLTSEEKYMEMVDKCFPDTNNTKEDFAPPMAGMPGDFPVYLRLPYRRDYYFCFYQEDMQTKFISILSDCIRHQNQDFLKKKTCEVQAFVKAIHLYRQEKGHYETWDMLIGSDVRVLANLTMEDLLPSLEKDLLPRLKGKKMEKKRVWFTTIEAAYYLVQGTLLEGMTALKDECKEKAQKKSALMRSDMDQIMNSRTFLESKLKARVAEPATKYCMKHVEPHLSAVLEEVMGPISQGFKEARELSEAMMEQLCQDFQNGMTKDKVQQALETMRKPDLQSCYEKVSELQDHIQELQQSFSYPNSKGLEHSTQIDIQQLVENVAYTFELLLHKAEQENRDLAEAMVKAKDRVLKQYDYDSSTVRKRIFQEALINITLPSIKAHLAPTFKKELPTFEQYIFADYVSFINVENVYEDILQQILEKEVSKVVKEAASMKKYNLFTESRYNFSVSSLHATPPGSIPSSPAHISTSPARKHAMPPSPLLANGSGKEPAALVVQEPKVVEPHVAMAQLQPVQAGGEQITEEKREKEISVCAEPETKITVPSTLPVMHMVHPTFTEETVEATPTATESLKEEENTKVEPAMVTSLSTETVDPSGSVTTQYTLTTLATPQVVPKAAQLVNSKPVQPCSAEDITEPLDQVAQNSEPLTSEVASQDPGPCSEASVEAPSTGEEKKSSSTAETEALVDNPPHESRESETTPDVVLSDDASWMPAEKEVVESTNEGDPVAEVTVEVAKLCKPDEFVIVKGESIADAEASLAVASGLASFAHSAAKEPPEANASTESAVNTQFLPSPTEAPTEAQPEARPLDCIKEIRDLVVEVIEVEEVVQRYPDDGEV
ncbi:protein Niban 1a [Salminus brasiliensis]|uniref:protein Niban 1a n=1 Tax=Salminus brasiliensis TaxID=930266 RepID=UPI003B82F619